jgi:hypothetical protein
MVNSTGLASTPSSQADDRRHALVAHLHLPRTAYVSMYEPYRENRCSKNRSGAYLLPYIPGEVQPTYTRDHNAQHDPIDVQRKPPKIMRIDKTSCVPRVQTYVNVRDSTLAGQYGNAAPQAIPMRPPPSLNHQARLPAASQSSSGAAKPPRVRCLEMSCARA